MPKKLIAFILVIIPLVGCDSTIKLKYVDCIQRQQQLDATDQLQLQGILTHARKIKGPYSQPPMSLAWPCEVELQIIAGSIPTKPKVKTIHLAFHQGDEIAMQLRHGKEVKLVFNEHGQLVR